MSDLPPAPPSPVRRRRVWILLRFVVVALVVVAAGLFFTRRQVGDRPVRSLDEWLSANGVFVSWQSFEWLPGVGVQLHGLALYRDAAGRVVSLTRGILGSAWNYAATSGLLQSATHSWSNTSGSGTFTYSYPHYDARRRITERDASPGISWTNIHYDSISQLTGAVVTTSNPTLSYSYDGRGNRNGGQGFTQTPNTLDQITSRASTSRGYGVVGSVNPAAQVSVLDSLSGSWQGLSVNSTTGAFSGWWNVPTSVNSGAAVLVNLTVRGTLAGGGANGTPAVADSNLNLLVPATAESPSYDGAGRLAEDALWTYSWDSLDRLLQMDRKAGTLTTTGSDGERMNFGYDADGRRTQVWHTVAYTDGHTDMEFRQVLYSGNLPVMEDEYLNGTKTRRRWFQWGADVSGTLEGAAGVGGLVAIYEEGARTLLLVDDGLGNVVAVVDANTHQMVAHYDYGPFGESLSASGDVDACPFRWQTRWYDKESDTYCFPNRYYSPRMGRWLSRDPMGEAGGFNLYAYAGNDPINRHDPLGLWDVAGVTVDPATGEALALLTQIATVPGNGLMGPMARQVNESRWMPLGVNVGGELTTETQGMLTSLAQFKLDAIGDNEIATFADAVHTGLESAPGWQAGEKIAEGRFGPGVLYFGRDVALATVAPAAASKIFGFAGKAIGALRSPFAGTAEEAAESGMMRMWRSSEAGSIGSIGPRRPAVPSTLVNALQEFQGSRFQFGSATYQLDRRGLAHILERHHPAFWNGSTRAEQTFFAAKMPVEEVADAVGTVMRQNRAALVNAGPNSIFQIEGNYNGIKFILGINKGRVAQFYPLE